MKPNIGIINALCRITMGFTMLSWATAKLVKHPWRDSYIIAAMLGGMKVGEGITRFCPITAVYKNYCNTQKQDDYDTTLDDTMLKDMVNPS